MRTLLTLLLIVHGSIHLLGFLKAWHLAALPQLSGRTLIPLAEPMARAIGVLWLVTGAILVGAAALRLAGLTGWWMAAAAGVVLSQLLLVLQWHDAWPGTLVNVILLVAVLVGAASVRFHRQVDEEVRTLFSPAPAAAAVVQPADLAPLPPPVRRWLTVSGVVGKERVHSVRLKQRGLMRTSPTQGFMPARAEQYFRVDQPGFVWRVRVTLLGFIPVLGRDKYAQGKGNMLIKAGALVSVVDATGDKIDQGTLLRYLGEMVWFPSAVLSPYLTWEPLSADSARATMSYRGVTASAVFSFDRQGRFASLSAERYLGAGADAALHQWFIPATEWKVFHGVEVPSKGDVIWKLNDGDYDYYRWEITDIEYNRPALYEQKESPL